MPPPTWVTPPWERCAARERPRPLASWAAHTSRTVWRAGAADRAGASRAGRDCGTSSEIDPAGAGRQRSAGSAGRQRSAGSAGRQRSVRTAFGERAPGGCPSHAEGPWRRAGSSVGHRPPAASAGARRGRHPQPGRAPSAHRQAAGEGRPGRCFGVHCGRDRDRPAGARAAPAARRRGIDHGHCEPPGPAEPVSGQPGGSVVQPVDGSVPGAQRVRLHPAGPKGVRRGAPCWRFELGGGHRPRAAGPAGRRPRFRSISVGHRGAGRTVSRSRQRHGRLLRCTWAGRAGRPWRVERVVGRLFGPSGAHPRILELR